jgi:hypothetical protein
MQKYNKNSWKQKIDPATDRLVKFYIDGLTRLEKTPNEGQLHFRNDFIESIIAKSDWQTAYNYDLESYKDLFSYLTKLGALNNKDMKLIFDAINSLETPEETLKICPAMIRALPEEESRQFYIKRLESFKAHPDFKPDSDSFDKNTLDFYSTIISLIIRYLFAKLEEEKEIVNQEIDYFRKSNAVIGFLGAIVTCFSPIANQMGITELKDKISEGDDKSIFKAVTIDKSFLYNEDVKKRILHAQLSGDTDFLKKLGTAIGHNPLKRIGQHAETYAVLNLFWFVGLYRLTNQELYGFLKSCGLIPPAYPNAFQKFVKRNIRSVYSF